MEGLDDHSPVILGLFRMAPNDDPDLPRLRDLLMQLHDVFGIFPDDETNEAKQTVALDTCQPSSRQVASDVHSLLDAGQKQYDDPGAP